MYKYIDIPDNTLVSNYPFLPADIKWGTIRDLTLPGVYPANLEVKSYSKGKLDFNQAKA
jgi:hypothetical protein